MAGPAYLDTCTLYGANVTDTILRLAERGAFEPRWSPDVMRELRKNLIESGLASDKVDRRIDHMQEAFPNADVRDYQHLEGSLTCDSKDRHVLAAAIRSQCQDLVTFNLKDFPKSSTEPHGVNVIHPDAFLKRQLEADPRGVVDVLEQQAAVRQRPPMSVHQLVDKLERAGVPSFAADVRTHLGPRDPTEGLAPAQNAAQAPESAPDARRQTDRTGPDLGHQR